MEANGALSLSLLASAGSLVRPWLHACTGHRPLVQPAVCRCWWVPTLPLGAQSQIR
eukprot:COSAG01_NODE_3698_length_5784_cov_5.069129_3_plen_56_part_00